MSHENRAHAASAPPVILAARFLLPLHEDLTDDSPTWSRAGRWFVPVGLVIGILYAVIFGLIWRGFGEYQFIRWLPAVAVLTADLGFLGYRMLGGAAAVAARRFAVGGDGRRALELPSLVAVLLIALVKFAMLLSLPRGEWASPQSGAWDGADWTGHLGFLYPTAVYRPLILMPLWGRWAVSVAVLIGRIAPGEPPRLQRMAHGARLTLTAAFWLVACGLTVLYCGGTSVNIPRALAISLVVFVITYLVSFLLARRAGGQTEATVLATGEIAEVAFLALYILAASAIYWY